MVIEAIPQHYTTKFSLNFLLKLQQAESRLRGTVKTESGSGESIRISRIGVGDMVEITTRGGKSEFLDQDMELRWIRPRKFKFQRARDLFDLALLEPMISPDGDIITTGVRAANREIDDLIIAAAIDTAYEGETGTTPVVLPESQKVGVQDPATHNTGLTFEKVDLAAYKLDEAENPMEGRTFVFSAKGKSDLIQDVLTNHAGDAVSVRQVESWQGGEGAFRGFNFVMSNRLPIDGNDIQTSIAYHRDGIAHGIWMDLMTSIDRLPTDNHKVGMSVYMMHGAARIEELSVVTVACDRSP